MRAGNLADQVTGYEPVGVVPIREFESPPALHHFYPVRGRITLALLGKPVVMFRSCTKSSKVSCPEDNQGANFMTIRQTKHEQDLDCQRIFGVEVIVVRIKRDGWDMRV